MKRIVTWSDLYERIQKLPKGLYYGIPRGGQYIAGATGCAVNSPEEATIIIDDLYDSGATYRKWKKKYPDKEFIFLFDKRKELADYWLVFPWEIKEETDIEDHYNRVLQYHSKEVTELNKSKLKQKLNEL